MAGSSSGRSHTSSSWLTRLSQAIGAIPALMGFGVGVDSGGGAKAPAPGDPWVTLHDGRVHTEGTDVEYRIRSAEGRAYCTHPPPLQQAHRQGPIDASSNSVGGSVDKFGSGRNGGGGGSVEAHGAGRSGGSGVGNGGSGDGGDCGATAEVWRRYRDFERLKAALAGRGCRRWRRHPMVSVPPLLQGALVRPASLTRASSWTERCGGHSEAYAHGNGSGIRIGDGDVTASTPQAHCQQLSSDELLTPAPKQP